MARGGSIEFDIIGRRRDFKPRFTIKVDNGLSTGATIFDNELGVSLPDVSRVTWDLQAGGIANLTIVYEGVGVEIDSVPVGWAPTVDTAT